MRRFWTVILFLALLFSLSLAIAFVWWIHPFHRQTPDIILIAYTVRFLSPWLTLICAAVSLVALIKLWGEFGWFGKLQGVFAVILIGVCVWFTRQNHFEWMFHPLPNPAFAHANDATYLKPGDMVLAVNINGEAAAYPVRLMGYHHIVHDTVGGQPIVATY